MSDKTVGCAAMPYCNIACIMEPVNENRYTDIVLHINFRISYNIIYM